MTKVDTIYLDLDGVLVDFAVACDAMLDSILFKPLNSQKTYSIEDHQGKFRTPMFWGYVKENKVFTKAKPTPFALELIAYCCNKVPNVYIASSTSGDYEISKQKLKWLKKYHLLKHVIFISDKYLLAKDNTILIDDFPYNVEKFIASGGNAILCPQPYNQAVYAIKEKISPSQSFHIVKAQIQSILERE